MIFCYSKVNDITGPPVLASQIHRFIISLLQILLFYMNIYLKERKTRKREKIDTTDLFDKFLITYKQTHVSVNGQQGQTECSGLWCKIKKGKENAATKSEAEKLMLLWKMNVRKPGKGSVVNSFTKAATTKKDELFIKMI